MAKNVVQSERLWLQPINAEEHLEGYHALNSEEKIMKWSSDASPRSLEHTKAKLISRMPSDDKPWMEMYAVILRPTDTEPASFIGAMGIIRLSADGEAAELGYGILPAHWGKGLAPEALKALVAYYWTSERKLPKEKLNAATEPGNFPSQRVCEKAGFRKKGVLEKAFQLPNAETGEMEWRSVIIWEVERPKA